jgi:HPt (histidine-containing phosphotransfer) domain-containing protein
LKENSNFVRNTENMIIDAEQFRDTFKPFDKEVVVEIIDIFFEEWPERFKNLKNDIDSGDLDSLRFNAHSLKGVIANFVAPGPKELAKQLEDNARAMVDNNNKVVFEKLVEQVDQLMLELKDLRKEFL